MSRLPTMVTVLAVMGSASLSACGGGVSADSPAASATPTAVVGVVDVVVDTANLDKLVTVADVGAPCTEGAGLAAGDSAVIENAEGTVIGLGELVGGVMVNESAAPPNRACRLEFTVEVPDSTDLAGDFFTLRLGASGGEEFTLTAKELTDGPALQVGEYYWH